jgi:hypothetical protein
LRAVVTRRLLMVLVLGAALALTGCGNKIETRTIGETEGLYIDVGDLKYQVQISRIINPRDIEDRHYLTGLPPGTLEPKADEAWFGVWLRVQNTTSEETFDTATQFEIVDTQENSFEPIELEENEWAYMPERLGPNTVLPNSESPAGQGPIQGSLLLFKLTTDALQNRPLEFKITNPNDPEDVGIVDLDV